MLIEEDIFEEFYIVIVWWIKVTFMYVLESLIKFIKLTEKAILSIIADAYLTLLDMLDQADRNLLASL